MGLREAAAVSLEFGGWIAKRAKASIMGWDDEIYRLRRRVGADPQDHESYGRLRALEARAGHDRHIPVEKSMTQSIGPENTFVLEGYDREAYIPGTLEIETVGDLASYNKDFKFEPGTGRVVWLVEPALDQQLLIRWKQWEPESEQKSDEVPRSPFFEPDQPWE